jgi:hypothetical protein
VPLASASGALILKGFLCHDKKEPSGLRPGVWLAFSSIKKTLWRLADLFLDQETLWRLADLFLDQENSLASGGPFPRSRKLSGARLALTGPNWVQWLLRQNRADQERA